jgi:hypothetical protein
VSAPVKFFLANLCGNSIPENLVPQIESKASPVSALHQKSYIMNELVEKVAETVVVTVSTMLLSW